jgi:hypothetical protein
MKATTIPKVQVRAALGRKIPGDGTIYIAQSSTSPLIGECIYCGSRDGLSDEHSIPFALFGTATLKKATCKRCAVGTQRVEQRLLRDTFGQAREFLRFPTRKAKKTGRWSGTRAVVDRRSGLNMRAPLGYGPVALCLSYPDYPPRLLAAEPLGELHRRRAFAYLPLNDPDGWLPDHIDEDWTPFNPTDIERCVSFLPTPTYKVALRPGPQWLPPLTLRPGASETAEQDM